MPIHPDTDVGTVRLTVADLERSRQFYERALGLRATERDDGTLVLGVDGEAPLIELTGDAAAPSRPRRTTGLFHLAVLLPTRRDLAVTIRRLVEARVPLDGASDHLVSEALYLHDPDGNGIEIYRDRAREEWPHADGSLEMATLPLDLEDVITELPPASAKDAFAPPGTRMGHVHLQVSNLDEAEAFYSGVLGFDIMVKGYAGAL
ncbi:MAG TPA: VOC family protein, partial [Solirubrobacteraceae bacterium]|nr:VOC family protein [Solirubrobacteraceae bacterium]